MALYGGLSVFFFSFVFISVIVSYGAAAAQLVGQWFTFKKMHLPGWKGLIPVYNLYVLFDELWEVRQFWRLIIYLCVYMGLMFLGSMFAVVGGVLASDSAAAGLVLLIIGAMMLIASIVMIVMAIVKECQLYSRLARAFGKGAGWVWGLLFVPFIIYPVFGFNRNIVYYGPLNQA